MYVGIDDTDSEKRMCTTYLAALLCEKLGTVELPRLIRLNPNIPYKTRGNGAVCLIVEGDRALIKKTVLDMVGEYAQFEEKKTNPGVVFIEKLNPADKKKLRDFYRRAVSELVSIENAEKCASSVGAEFHKFKNGRGIIGALAAIGAELPDKTYEIIAYRSHRKKEKKIDVDSIYRMDKETYPETFNNIDNNTGRILIFPHGYDPVFCGIRGNSKSVVEKAWAMVKPLEEIERTQIFVTNQGTDAHLRKKKIAELKPYDCAILNGTVAKEPRTIAGGHILFGLRDLTGEITCAAYKPTGPFRNTVKKLLLGDRIEVFGGISKHPNTFNLEKIRILKLAKVYLKDSPTCCGRRMTSAGKGKGYKCRKCGKRAREIRLKEVLRDLVKGFYEVPPGARRHLSMPLIRMKPKAGRSTGKE